MNKWISVLPDMIGGNGYNNHPPNEEMLIRWLQANVFMPSLQFSYLPWDYNNATVTQICKTFTELHTSYGSLIEQRFSLAVSTGAPVNPPIWWIDPSDATAQVIDDGNNSDCGIILFILPNGYVLFQSTCWERRSSQHLF